MVPELYQNLVSTKFGFSLISGHITFQPLMNRDDLPNKYSRPTPEETETLSKYQMKMRK